MPSQEFRVLLFEFGILILAVRLLRPFAQVAGLEPKVHPVTQLSVPYSEFLDWVNSDQVEKVEINGVHMKFKLRHQAARGDEEFGSETSNLQESGMLMRNIPPSQRIVYTTTRPADIKTNYEKMLENGVEFGSPDKQSGGYLNIALVRI